ncbi:unnamed protein product [Camellia sinensis]
MPAVERWLVDIAVLPIENSLGGSIYRNYDLLLRHRLHVAGEVKLAIRHCLQANHGIKVQDLKRVLSHPQALAQCENTLTRLGMVRKLWMILLVQQRLFVAFHKLNDTGPVATSTAARIYGMNILDDSDNVTRFLVLAREPIIPGTDRLFKTSIVFSLEEGPGMLFKALAVFPIRDINLTKLLHRLLANHGVKVQDLKMVLSHPQCDNTLTRLGMVRKAFVTFHKLNDTGPVATSTAARIYGMNSDDSDNVTRFLVLAREPIIPSTNRLFKEGPRMLFKALVIFAMRDINLTKIESRPLQKKALQTLDDNNNGFPKRFPYLFYVDFEASMADQKAQNALGHLKEIATFLRVLSMT